MLKVGITGGIGGGKSTVSKIVTLFGYPVYDSDEQARMLMVNSETLVAQIKQLLGNDVYVNGQLDRRKIASKVFSNQRLLNHLEQIVHPAVQKHFNAWCLVQNTPIVFKEAAILFESGGDKFLDYVICVTADEQTRKARVIKRDNMPHDEVNKRMDKQWTDQQKIDRSDFVIYADDEHSVIRQVKDVLSLLEAKL